MVWIDISCYLIVHANTGIQRVVNELLKRLIVRDDLNVTLISYSYLDEGWFVFGKEQALRCLADKHDVQLPRCNYLPLDGMNRGDVFLDIDSAWDATVRRTVLYPALKGKGVKIVSYIYDIIPINRPRDALWYLVIDFSYFVAAILKYSDAILSETNCVLAEIGALKERFALPQVPMHSTWLGSDFKHQAFSASMVDDEVKTAASGQFVLMIGTIQPLKNHVVVLDAFDKVLFQKGLKLVIVGMIGWKVEKLIDRIKNHPLFGKQLFLLGRLSDDAAAYLYERAFCVAFSSLAEGFGLPTIEALQRGTPVIASDIPVLREVGGDFCRYFDPLSPDAFVETITPLLGSENEYQALRAKVATYRPVTWDEVTDTIVGIVKGLENAQDPAAGNVMPSDQKPLASCYAPCETGGSIRFDRAFRGIAMDITESTWTTAQAVRLPLELSGDLGKLYLFMRCDKFVHDQNVTIFANEKPLMKRVVSGRQTFVVPIARRILGGGAKLLLRMELPNAVSPFEMGINDDRRQLGLHIEDFRIESAKTLLKVTLGERYFFSDNQGAKACGFAVRGLSYLEGGYSWTDGEELLLDLYLGNLGWRTITVRLDCEPLLPVERVWVCVNGLIASVRKVQARSELAFRFRTWRIGRDGIAHVKIKLPDAASPKDHGGNGDERKLGLKLYSFVVE